MGFSPVVATRGLLSGCRARPLGCALQYLRRAGSGAADSRAPERRLSSCGTQAWLLLGTWDLPGPEIEPQSPALAGGFFATEPPGKPAFV